MLGYIIECIRDIIVYVSSQDMQEKCQQWDWTIHFRINEGKTIINHPILMVYSTNLW
jgi:predicted GTPase